MHERTLKPSLALLLAAALLPVVGLASDQDDARKLSKAGTIVPLERITAQVRKQQRIERILEVDLESSGQNYYYEVEVVDDGGVVRKLRYDAATGTPLGDAPDDD